MPLGQRCRIRACQRGLQSGFAESERYQGARLCGGCQACGARTGRIIEETAPESLGGWNLEKIDIGSDGDESHATVERLKSDLTVVRKMVSGQVALKSELRDALDAPSRFEAR